MNPVVVIATHQRKEITSINIESIAKQTLAAKVVIVVSDNSERDYYKKYDVEIVVAHNIPLGNKWQTGVNKAMHIGANPVIITGSDDLLDKRFVERSCIWMDRGFHFVGLKGWYVYNQKKLYEFKYVAPLPLGGGRAYSSEFLKQSGNIFEVSKNRHMDDHGWNKVKFSNVKRIVFNDPLILSIKGDWPMMNKAEDFFTSKNCQLKGECDVSIMQSMFNYDPETVLH